MLGKTADSYKVGIYISDDALQVGLGNDGFRFFEDIFDIGYRLIIFHNKSPIMDALN